MNGSTTVRWFAVVSAKPLIFRKSRLLRGGCGGYPQAIENIVRWLCGGAPPHTPPMGGRPFGGDAAHEM